VRETNVPMRNERMSPANPYATRRQWVQTKARSRRSRIECETLVRGSVDQLKIGCVPWMVGWPGVGGCVSAAN